MNFILADELKKHYEVLGNFYKLEYSNGDELECRNTLEIYTKSNSNDIRKKNSPDAVFIMMNPGKSRPKDKNYEPPIVKERDIKNSKAIKISLIETVPDITQYQVMRIMREKNWKHIRILNLSDYREAQSPEFYKKIKQLKKSDKESIHSIFSGERFKELNNLIDINNKPNIIVAWGRDKALSELICKAISSKKLEERIGCSESDDQFYYSHASPRLKEHKIKWLDNILDQI